MDINKDVLETTGHLKENIQGRRCFEVFHNFDEPCETIGRECPVSRVFLTGRSHSSKKELQKVDKSKTWLDILYSPLKDDMGNTGMVIRTSRNISREMVLEQRLRQTQKLEAIGTLAGGIAHDFNNILSAIVGFTELCIYRNPENKILDSYLHKVLDASTRAKNLVNQILTFSRQGEQERKPIQLAPIIKETLKLIRASLPATIEIEQSLNADSAVILGDPTQVHQIIMTLCTNAAQAMNMDGGVLSINLENIELTQSDILPQPGMELGRYVKLSVTDTGHGIEPIAFERMYDPCYTTKEKGQENGLGLGLAVVHGILKNHDGIITVRSELGKGSIFDVYLPRIDHINLGLPVENFGSLPRGNERVLFIDDEKPLVELGVTTLEELGYSVTGTTSSNQALKIFKSNPENIDIIVTDQTMPVMKGTELARAILNEGNKTSIILCTGFSDQISSGAEEMIGIDEILLKPYGMRELAETLRNVLDNSGGH